MSGDAALVQQAPSRAGTLQPRHLLVVLAHQAQLEPWPGAGHRPGPGEVVVVSGGDAEVAGAVAWAACAALWGMRGNRRQAERLRG